MAIHVQSSQQTLNFEHSIGALAPSRIFCHKYFIPLDCTHVKRAHTTTTQSLAQNNIPRGENLHVLHLLLRSYPATNRGLVSMRSMILSLSVNRGRVIDATKRVRVHAMGTYSPENWTAPLICGHVSIGYIQNSRTNRPPRRD